MKIITWNACCKFREKYSLLSQYDADILVIQECEDPSRSLCQAYRAFSGQYVWTGANKNKGLGIFCKPGLQIDSLNWESRSLSYFLPVRINDSFDLIGVWACKPYIEAIYEYGKLFKNPRAKPDGTKMFCSAFLNDARMCCFFANAIVKY